MERSRAEELLADERRRIESGLAARRDPPPELELSSADQHLADDAQGLAEREVDEALVEQLEDELAALERAEARLAAGTFGRSVESGAAIPDDRLEADPLAELTVEEERRLEREG